MLVYKPDQPGRNGGNQSRIGVIDDLLDFSIVLFYPIIRIESGRYNLAYKKPMEIGTPGPIVPQVQIGQKIRHLPGCSTGMQISLFIPVGAGREIV